jgi:hypothetical protein
MFVEYYKQRYIFLFYILQEKSTELIRNYNNFVTIKFLH